LVVVPELIKCELGAWPSREQKKKKKRRRDKRCGGFDAKRLETRPPNLS
jgi:hypothetical protein